MTVENLRKLYEDISRCLNMKEFSDKEWLSDEEWFGQKTVPSYETKWLMVLSWAHRTLQQQLRIYHRAHRGYVILGKKFNEFEDDDVKVLGYDIEWQNRFMRNLISYLKKNNLTFDEFVEQLRNMTSYEAMDKMKKVLGTRADKIIGVFLRDYLRMPAFPIDIHVRDVLKAYDITPDQQKVMIMCERLKINPSELNRAVYSFSMGLTRPHWEA